MSLKKIMKNLQNKQFKVVRVDAKEFKLENGDVYPIPFKMKKMPSIKEFQKMVDDSKDLMIQLMEKVEDAD